MTEEQCNHCVVVVVFACVCVCKGRVSVQITSVLGWYHAGALFCLHGKHIATFWLEIATE